MHFYKLVNVIFFLVWLEPAFALPFLFGSFTLTSLETRIQPFKPSCETGQNAEIMGKPTVICTELAKQ